MLIEVKKEDELKRIDLFISENLNLNRSFVQEKIENSFLKINGCCVKKSYKIKEKDQINIEEEFFENQEFNINDIKPYEVKIDIIYENDDLIVINKQKGLTVHPGSGNKDETLMNALVYYFKKENLSNLSGLERLGIVHRLDKNTSGLMIVAKNNEAHANLSKQIQEKSTFKREYFAICEGVPMPPSGYIEKYMKKGSYQDGRMMICKEGDHNARFSKTYYEVVKIFHNGLLSLVKCKLHTGRTHQIRLHLSSIKHPIFGDRLYNGKNLMKINGRELSVNSQLLYSAEIEFLNPRDGKILNFKLPYPDEFKLIM